MARKNVNLKVFTNKLTGQKSVMIPEEGFAPVGDVLKVRMTTKRKRR